MLRLDCVDLGTMGEMSHISTSTRPSVFLMEEGALGWVLLECECRGRGPRDGSYWSVSAGGGGPEMGPIAWV